MSRLSAAQARDLLKQHVAELGADCEPIITVNKGAREEARSIDWWYEGNVEEDGSITGRTIAYLRTYRAAAVQPKLYAIGIPLTRGRLWMDKYVIRRLHKDRYLKFETASEPYFALTDKADELL